MGVCNCSMFCCTLLCVHSSISIVLMGKKELIALLNLYSWCLVIVGRLFHAVPWGCLQFVVVVFPDHTHLLFLSAKKAAYSIFFSGEGVAIKVPVVNGKNITGKYYKDIVHEKLKNIRNDALSLVWNISVFYMAMSLLMPPK